MSKFRSDEMAKALKQESYSCRADRFRRALSMAKGFLMIPVLLVGMSGCSDNLYEEEVEPTEVIVREQPPDAVGVVVVEIKGEVVKPGVYTIEENKRLNDLLLVAGGRTVNAELRHINLARKLKDGDSFYIPGIGEEIPKDPGSGTGFPSQNEEKGKIDINEATREELMSVPGIGPATADNILSYKKSVGAFKTIEDLLEVDRIGDKTLEKLKEYLEVR